MKVVLRRVEMERVIEWSVTDQEADQSNGLCHWRSETHTWESKVSYMFVEQ